MDLTPTNWQDEHVQDPRAIESMNRQPCRVACPKFRVSCKKMDDLNDPPSDMWLPLGIAMLRGAKMMTRE
jgi:hypothetical protein